VKLGARLAKAHASPTTIVKQERVMQLAVIRDDCEVAVIGAGPYGLAVAAHLKSANVATRVYGTPMSFWRNNMPKGMKLRSPWRATHIADPDKRFTLDVHAHQHAFDTVEDRLPLEQFVAYGEWFQRQTVPDLDTRNVIRIEETGRGFCLVLEGGEPVRAQRVVVATGLVNQDFRPAPFVGLPAELVSHSSAHSEPRKWRGRRVAVVGRGQSACESAALLREAGSDVELICRGDIRWTESAQAQPEPAWLSRLCKALLPPSGVGALPLGWLNELPGIANRAPARIRGRINEQTLRPTAADWLKRRLEGVRIQAGREIAGVIVKGNQVGVQLDNGLRVYDHVVLATGYRPDITKLRMLARELREKIAHADGSPALAAGFESTVPGLHFVGASAVHSFGPLLNFVAGTGYAGRSVTRAIVAKRAQREHGSVVEMDCDFLTSADPLRR
jgi:cation diffusion facilitator CzcD-associated flavoprotein CzcO